MTCSISRVVHNKTLLFLFNLHHRTFSALPISELDETTNSSDYITWVGKCWNPIPLLHETLKTCSRDRRVEAGKACHALIITVGLRSDTSTSNMVMNMYSKCGFVGPARNVFDEMPERSIVSWNTMIGCLTQSGNEREALVMFSRMRKRGGPFSEFTLSSVLCACAGNSAVLECRQLHGLAIKMAMDPNVFVGTALLDVYAKCGFVIEACNVFERMPDRNLVTWCSMVAGYVRNAFFEEALVLFQRARIVGLELDTFFVSSAICACSGLASLIQGNQVHAMLCKAGFGSNIFIEASLIDMYSKCGSIGEAYKLFCSSEDIENVVLWNSMISGFAKHARSLEAMVLFEKMQQSGLLPDEVTYVAVLSMCSHVGMVENGRKYFSLMRRVHNLSPSTMHYSTMVDILGRSGHLDEALGLIETMPFETAAPIWGSLLASCRNHGNIELAEIAAERLFEIEPNNAGNLVMLSNVYAVNKKWDKVARTRKALRESDMAKKEKGKSWIEIKNQVHSFMAGERDHHRIVEIYAKLEVLVEEVKKIGYNARSEDDLHDVEESKKSELLRHHSEKLALVFGLMCLPSNAPIRIIKNLRICRDCHSFMKLVSSFTGRVIIVRDNNRFHHFKNGSCSCREFW